LTLGVVGALLFLILVADFFGQNKHNAEAQKLPPTALAYKINERWVNLCALHMGLFILWLVSIIAFLFIG
jgi:hypothetical protein